MRDHARPTDDEEDLAMGSGTGIWMAIVSPGNEAHSLSRGRASRTQADSLGKAMGKPRKAVMSAFVLFKTLRNHWFHLHNRDKPALSQEPR